MINLVKVNEGLKPNIQLEEYHYCYKLVKDEETIGFGTINKNKENLLFVFISEENRGNGYGKILFEKMLQETKNIGHKEARVTFNKGNIPMLKIVSDNGGVHLSSNEELVKYVIPLK